MFDVNTVKRMLVGFGGSCALFALSGCGAAIEEEGESTAVTTERLLNIPGPFYTNAPQYGWCGATLLGTSGDCHAGYSSNSTGATNTYTRLTTGLYKVFFPGLSLGGNVQITPVGSNARCNLITTTAVAGGVEVELSCRNQVTAFVDTTFQVSYYKDTNVGGSLGAYALVHTLGPLSVSDVWNSAGGGATVTSLGTGVYRVTFPGQVFGADTVLVTPANMPALFCKAAGWSSTGTGVAVDVRCFSFGGSPANAEFSISYNQNLRAEPRNTLPVGTQGGFSLVTAAGATNPSFSRNTCSAGTNTSSQVAIGQYNETFHSRSPTGPEFPTAGLVTARGTNGNYCNLSSFVLQSSSAVDMRAVVKCYNPQGNAASTDHETMVMQQSPGSGC